MFAIREPHRDQHRGTGHRVCDGSAQPRLERPQSEVPDALLSLRLGTLKRRTHHVHGEGVAGRTALDDCQRGQHLPPSPRTENHLGRIHRNVGCIQSVSASLELPASQTADWVDRRARTSLTGRPRRWCYRLIGSRTCPRIWSFTRCPFEGSAGNISASPASSWLNRSGAPKTERTGEIGRLSGWGLYTSRDGKRWVRVGGPGA